jgi:hypothetical protein
LKDGGDYELRVKTDINGQIEEEISYGNYRLRGDRVVLSTPNDSDRTEFIFDGSQLRFEADWSERLVLKAIGVDQAALVKVPTVTVRE